MKQASFSNETNTNTLHTEKKMNAFHPFLIGIFPLLSLLAENFSQVVPLLTLRAFIFTVIFLILTFWVLQKIIREQHRAALILSVCFIFFFTYGHVYDLLEGRSLFGFLLGRHLVLAPLWLVVWVAALFLIFKSRKNLEFISGILNAISVILVCISLMQIGWQWIHTPHSQSEKPAVNVQIQASADMPDVYYIILDAYSREDMMQKYHELDIRIFVETLEKIGFVFPSCTQSNYSITALSLASSLNMNYVEEVSPDIVQQNLDWGNFSDPIIHSDVRSEFEQLGYSFVSFETGISWDEITDADIYFARQKSPFLQMLNFRQVTEFEVLYLRTTALRVLDELRATMGFQLTTNIQTPQQDHYDRILYVLDQLENSSTIHGPKFVFLHIMAPHGPWVIGANGEYSFTDDEKSGYANEVQFLNNHLPAILQKIIENSAHPPVIILQGDHGYYNEERMAILNAYYLPGDGKDDLYTGITPVNTFRVIFNHYLGANYELLPDHSYLSDRDIPYEFEEISYPCTVP
jgi:hypothetical protein